MPFQAYYLVQQFTLMQNTVSTLAFTIQMFDFPLSTCYGLCNPSFNLDTAIIIPPLAEWWVCWNTLVRPSVRPSLNLVYVTSRLSFVGFYSYLVSWLAMNWACTYYTDFMDGWFCDSRSPFHVCLNIRPFAHLVYATSHLSFVVLYSYLVTWLAMIWACAYYTDFTDGWFLREL